jgi:raffinose synthase
MKKTSVILMIITGMMLQTTTNAQEILTTKASGTGIDIVYKGKTRVTSGAPLIENRTLSPKSFEVKTNEIIYKYNEASDIHAIFKQDGENIWGVSLSMAEEKRNGKEFAGFFFEGISGFRTGVEIWRYKPWNSWTKPIRVNAPSELHDWDVQFFYWKYDDGLYGAAIPLSGNGYRTTLGSEKGKFGCKALTYTGNAPAKDIPMMAVGFDTNPYELFNKLYRAGLKMMGKPENIRENKTYPEPLEYIGWCTWNSSQMGKNLDEKHLLEGTATFTNQKFPLGWLLIDDGWFDHDGSRLNAFTPNPSKFPNGFKSLTSKLKSEYGLKHVGIWHAYDGYWNGINPNSKLGEQYKDELFTWTQKERVEVESNSVTYSFISPESDSVEAFYEDWHKYFLNEGFTFVKVDNQLVTERMCVDNYPIEFLSKKMHEALYTSVFKNFNGAIINCMDMTNEAFYNFGKSAVARTVEDYFPERDGGVGYNLEKGGAPAHVLMALYNSLYFSQMVWPDFDMFESNNTYGAFHAIARAISGGPVYITDMPGQQKFDVLWPLIYGNGRILRADKPALLTEDCLFQLQDHKPLKAFSFAGNAGLMAVFNAVDTDQVAGSISPSQIEGLNGESFVVYEFFSKELNILKNTDKKDITLNRMDCRYYNFVPIQNGIALIGLVNKYNAPKTILSSTIEKYKIKVNLMEGGTFKALLPSKPVSVLVNDFPVKNYTFEHGVFTTTIQSSQKINLVISY